MQVVSGDHVILPNDVLSMMQLAGDDAKGKEAARSPPPRPSRSSSSSHRGRFTTATAAISVLSLSMLLFPAAADETLAAGGDHACVIVSAPVPGGVKCWGLNAKGQLGYQDKVKRGATAATLGAALGYVDLGTGRSAVSITAGDAHTCAVLDDGSLKVRDVGTTLPR